MSEQFKVLDHKDTLTTVPWAFLAPHERQAFSNHSQTLKRLNERGGLCWSEMLAVLEDRAWEPIKEELAQDLVLVMMAAWRNANSSEAKP